LSWYNKVGLEGQLETPSPLFDLAKLLVVGAGFPLEIRRTSFQEEVGRLAVNLSQANATPWWRLGEGMNSAIPNSL